MFLHHLFAAATVIIAMSSEAVPIGHQKSFTLQKRDGFVGPNVAAEKPFIRKAAANQFWNQPLLNHNGFSKLQLNDNINNRRQHVQQQTTNPQTNDRPSSQWPVNPVRQSQESTLNQLVRQQYQTFSKRKLQLPIISASYASTKYQGSSSPSKKPELKQPIDKIDIIGDDDVVSPEYDNGIENTEHSPADELVIEEESFFRPATSTTPVSTTTSTTTTPASSRPIDDSNNHNSYHTSSPYRRPQLVDDPVEQLFLNVQVSSNTNSQDKPIEPVVSSSNNDDLATGSVQLVDLFDNVDKSALVGNFDSVDVEDEEVSKPVENSPFILQPGDIEYDIDDDAVNKDEFVRFLAQPPKQIKFTIPSPVDQQYQSNDQADRIVVDNFDAQVPSKVKPHSTNKYQQLGSDDHHRAVPENKFVRVASDVGTQLDRHQPAKNSFKPSIKSHYPLGKPAEQRLPSRPVNTRKNNSEKPSSGSFFDFLLPSFFGSKPNPKPNKAAQPKVAQHPIAPKQQQQLLQQKHNHLLRLPVPNRPLNTFPNPQELGGRFNPIRITIPTGHSVSSPPVHSFPKPPTVEDYQQHAAQLQQSTLSARRGIMAVDDINDLSSPVSNNVITTMQKAERFVPKNQIRRINTDTASKKIGSAFAGSKQIGVESYENRLKDPNFVASITNAHVYHHKQPADEINKENVRISGPSGKSTQIQDANPFYFRPLTQLLNVVRPKLTRQQPPSARTNELTTSGSAGLGAQLRTIADGTRTISQLINILSPVVGALYK